MGIDRNQIIGIVILFLLFFGWTYMNRPTEEQLLEQRRQDSLAQLELDKQAEVAADLAAVDSTPTLSEASDTTVIVSNAVADARFGAYAGAASGTAKEVVLENDLVKITFSNRGAVITDVWLKEYEQIKVDDEREEYKVPLHLMNDPKNIFEYILPVQGAINNTVKTSALFFDVDKSGNTVKFIANASDGSKFVQTYTLQDGSYTLDYDIDVTGAGTDGLMLNWVTYLDKVEKNYGYEKYYTTVYYKEADDDVDYCNCRRSATEDVADIDLKWISHSNQFFNTSLIADERFGGGQMETEMLEDEDENLKILRSLVEVPFEGRETESFNMQMYVGPNEYERLRSFDASLEDIIPFGRSIFGTINRWIIRPLFNFLLGFISIKGIVILVLTLLVKLALYPLTYKMLHSQAKMSALKPEMAGLREKFKDDQQKMQMETMKIYREYGVSPLGGCLPMLAQMPIWFALYRFFPASIQFRQAEFLWATDLSSYDVFVNLPFEIPFYGAHVSLLTILWAGTTVLYTYYNTRHMDMATMNPAMKYMQYFMPIMFLFFFNNYASGLTLYLFFSNVFNIALTIGTKRLIFNQDKIRAELEANRAKPKKKGGFQQRLEKAMAEQQKMQSAKDKKKK